MAFGTKKSVVVAPSFSERMASNLHAEMESEIAALQEDIKTIGVTKQEVETFMSNILKAYLI